MRAVTVQASILHHRLGAKHLDKEVQDEESEIFKNYFNNDITYLEGSAGMIIILTRKKKYNDNYKLVC